MKDEGGLMFSIDRPDRRRRALVHLTDKVRTIRSDVQALRSGIDTQALAGFTSDEHDQLAGLLSRLVNNLHSLIGD
ncbi:hypothetical protein GCM10018980_70370 [Streptomyces capoamus]|uniref:HTH marR-type domain-containing protein n=2 Tax=Streptomyces capoamus TaxID=68183 RepID=A0A919F313_9ACTN|nr:hypothetical protein GCM10010501_17760 [Streptomyces libani subsp. rufus]GHG73851.1 hypothetical protein GCM10018980_70370 [Streptomyces capoamus]